ncbi:hypothetical protein Dsin_023275 [Dipteronia sinensis]|uniref:glycerophosphodiester phosphodiesterase n=1 Tax=Dipteronia sinensis TaxID=43782 RepID=A0AAE0A324_9ROSI|nr:hypothetical protein Dsin_023275 [Dipteronia sinensis]
MCNARALGGVVLLLLVVVVLHCNVVTLVSAQGSDNGTRWQTLSGDPPFVVARGGFSGLLPDSSFAAYNLGVMLSVPNVIAWCDVQLTKDAIGICFPDIKLQNASNIGDVYKNKDKVYLVNGVPIRGWFPIDYTFDDLAANVISEYLYFINNGDFSVDGVLSDFPITPSAAIDCFSHIGRNASKQAVISNPFADSILFRNPEFKNAGNFLKLSDFLTLAKNSATLYGVLISIEPGSLIQLVTAQYLPPAAAPMPILTESDIAEPPFPPVAEKTPTGGSAAASPTPSRNGQPRLAGCIFLSSLATLLAALLLF